MRISDWSSDVCSSDLIKAGPTGDCEVYWNMTKVTSQELLDRAVEKLKLEIARQGGVNAPDLELPEAHIRGDVDTPYHCTGGANRHMQMDGQDGRSAGRARVCQDV